MTNAITLRRPRDLGAIVSDAFALLFADWSSLARLVAPAVLVNVAFSLLIYAARDNEPAVLALLLAATVVQYVVYQLVSAAAIAYLNARDTGRPMETGDALDIAQDRFRDVVGAAVRATVIVTLLALTIVGIPWAIQRLVRWAFIIQSIIVDGQQGEPSLGYSASLVAGHWWGTFGRLAVATLVGYVIWFVISQLILLVLGGLAGVIVSHAADFFVLPFAIITTTLIFFDLKLRRTAHDGISAA